MPPIAVIFFFISFTMTNGLVFVESVTERGINIPPKEYLLYAAKYENAADTDYLGRVHIELETPEGFFSISGKNIHGDLSRSTDEKDGSMVHYYKGVPINGVEKTFLLNLPEQITHYADGKRHGARQTFYDGKQLASDEIYEHGRLVAAKEYFYNGSIGYERAYPDENGISRAKRYRIDGSLVLEEHYLDNQLHGLSKAYHPNGKVALEIIYVKGKPSGVQKLYHDNGLLSREIPFQNGVRQGIVKIYNENGMLTSEIPYQNGQARGLDREFEVPHLDEILGKRLNK